MLNFLTWSKRNSYVHPCGHGIQALRDDNAILNEVLDDICNSMNDRGSRPLRLNVLELEKGFLSLRFYDSPIRLHGECDTISIA